MKTTTTYFKVHDDNSLMKKIYCGWVKSNLSYNLYHGSEIRNLNLKECLGEIFSKYLRDIFF